jgi:IS6 family transposase
MARWRSSRICFYPSAVKASLFGNRKSPSPSYSPSGSWAVGANLYRAVDSAGETIEFILSVKSRPARGEAFPTLVVIRRRATCDQCGLHPAYAIAVAELKQSGELSRRSCCRTPPYLNNIIEQDHRFIRSGSWRVWVSSSVEGVANGRGYGAMHAIRKGKSAG